MTDDDIYQWLVNSTRKWPVTRKMYPFDDIIIVRVLANEGAAFSTPFAIELIAIVVFMLTSLLHNREDSSNELSDLHTMTKDMRKGFEDLLGIFSRIAPLALRHLYFRPLIVTGLVK